MPVIHVMPKKGAATFGKTEAFFRIVFDVFVGVGTVDKEKRRSFGMPEIPACRVAKMLADAARAGVAGKLSPDDPLLDQMEIIFGDASPVLVWTEVGWKVECVHDGVRTILSDRAGGMAHVSSDLEHDGRLIPDDKIKQDQKVLDWEHPILIFSDSQVHGYRFLHDGIGPNHRDRADFRGSYFSNRSAGEMCGVFEFIKTPFPQSVAESGQGNPSEYLKIFFH